MDDLKLFYTNLVDVYGTSLTLVKKQLFRTAVLRLLSFLLLLFVLYNAITKREHFIYLGVGVLLITLFLYLVSKSSRLESKKRTLQNLLKINENELVLLNHGRSFFDYSAGKTHETHYAEDLDVFGQASLFEQLNRTSLSQGRQALQALLGNTLKNETSIVEYQQAIKTAAPQNDVRQAIIASALQATAEPTVSPLIKWINEPVVLAGKPLWKLIRVALPVLNIILLFVSLQINEYYPVSISVLASWLVVGMNAKYVQQQYVLVGKKQTILQSFAEIIGGFNKMKTGDSSMLLQIQSQTLDAAKQLKKLSGVVNMLDQRLNMLVNILLNSLFIYDVQCLMELEKWKLQNKSHLPGWIENVGQIELLVSLSTYAFNHPKNVYPTIINTPVCIEATNLYHPLIPFEETVSNDVSIGVQNRLLLITGSNMSGKTTYLRTVGVNVIMAQCGLPVCATSFRFSPITIYSSIRISDSLQEHTSYFMAELKRLQAITIGLQSNKPALVLIDEILRGTNSDDKFYGSEAFVKKLIQYNTLTLFATHDLKLSELENQHEGKVSNYCFESTINGDDLSFDYKILPGVAKNRNATFLMKKMDII